MAKIESHFDREIQTQVRQVLSSAKFAIRIAMFSLNEDSLFRLLCHKAESDKIEVEILLDARQYEQNKNILTSSITRLENSGGSVFLYENTQGSFANMHHKFCIIDDKILITGSYNWTNNASKYSDENIVIINDVTAAFQFGEKFNALKNSAKLYNEDAELPIFFTTSKNVVKIGEQVTLSWKVPNADILMLNGENIQNFGSQTKTIYHSEKFILEATQNDKISHKTVSVILAQKANIIAFSASERIIMRGQNVIISWKVTNATKVQIEPFGDVPLIGTREHSPQTDTTYKLIAFDILGEEIIQEINVRVPDFKTPLFESIKIPTPQINFVVALELNKPNFSQNDTTKILSEILKKQIPFAMETSKQEQLGQMRSNQISFYKSLKNSIKEKSKQIKYKHLKEFVINYTENVLTQLLKKIRQDK